MAESYANIRRALALLDSEDALDRATGHATLRDQCHPDTIRALLKERDAWVERFSMVLQLGIPEYDSDLIEWKWDEGSQPFDSAVEAVDWAIAYDKQLREAAKKKAAIAAANGGGNG